MQFNYSKLLGRMRERGFTQKDIADHICMNATTLSQKLNHKARFNANEIDSICKLLDIAKEDIGAYFFTV